MYDQNKNSAESNNERISATQEGQNTPVAGFGSGGGLDHQVLHPNFGNVHAGMDSETIKVNDIDLSIKEYKGQRVVTLKDIDMVHQRPEGTAGRNFSKNRRHFIEDVDFYHLSYDEVRSTKFVERPNSQGLTLLTESGYLMLVKSFTDDIAWAVQRQLVNTYFRATPDQKKEAAQQTLSDLEILSRAFLISQKTIAQQNDTIDMQRAKIEADAPAVAFANDISLSKDGITVGRYAKSLFNDQGIKIGQNRLFKFLRDLKVLQADNIPYQKYLENGWFRVRQVSKNGKLFDQALICGKGQQKVYELIKAKYFEGRTLEEGNALLADM